ncbi:cytochrome c oxidase assembly protein [Microbacterium sp. Marseille-Q6965]|uniref:cytochrome c oxidase assembly protein n=1 Tax=Microbacterium sp. Marseille-Q6965 TaxID=2965072 RepID=UPI0021B78872|nr:cytochrome c oxidase assembly protein [Microbacterium sp. Marseille-Q6965]
MPVEVAAHVHSGHGGIPVEAFLLLPFAVAAIAYLASAIREQRTGRGWQMWRTAIWMAGLVAAALGFAGPLAAAAHGGFVAHVGVHVLVGMIAPLLLVYGAPATLALRTLATVPARRLSRLLRSPLARFLTHPVVAALLNVGGLWVIHLTPLHGMMMQDPFLHLLVTAHFLIAGYLFTTALVSVDPNPHRAGLALRATVLVLSLAAHGVLAKLLFVNPPAGVPAAQARDGALLMFYGGDAVDLVLMVLLCAEWYRRSGRRLDSVGATVEVAEPAAASGERRG